MLFFSFFSVLCLFLFTCIKFAAADGGGGGFVGGRAFFATGEPMKLFLRGSLRSCADFIELRASFDAGDVSECGIESLGGERERERDRFSSREGWGSEMSKGIACRWIGISSLFFCL